MPPDIPNEGPAPDPPPSFAEPGEHAAPADLDYELVRLIGRGGYGEVWMVRDKAGAYLACKVVYRESFQSERPYAREYEGICNFEPVSRASNDQVQVLHVGRRDSAGYFYYIMELADDVVTGRDIDPARYVPRTLKSEVEHKGRLPVADCVEIGKTLGRALENLHQHGLIHRDIKPANVIFVNGTPKLADIGLVTGADVTVSYVGTEGFIPPEGPGSAQADIYALGKVLYEISTGKDRLEYPELSDTFAEAPDWEQRLELNAIVAKACEPNLQKRYVSAKELDRDLCLLSEGKSVRRARSIRRTWINLARGVVASAVLVLGLIGVNHLRKPAHSELAVAPTTKLPSPDPALVQKSEAEVKEKFRRQLNGKSAGSKQEAALALLKQGSANEDPAVRMASLRVAALLALEAGDFSLAMEVCDAIDQRFQIDIVPLKLSVLTQAGAYARNKAKKDSLAEYCLTTGFQAMAADDYVNAEALATTAARYAGESSSPRLLKESDFLRAESSRCDEVYGTVKHANETLKTTPGDPQASLSLGEFFCFFKNDWDRGLPLLARGGSEDLKRIACDEMTNRPTSTPGRLNLANQWWDFAEHSLTNQEMFEQRARYWYLRAIAGAPESEKSGLREQFANRLKSVPTQSGEVHITSRATGTEQIDIYSDEIQWKSIRSAFANKINRIPVGDIQAGGLKIIKNTGQTRYLPDAIDFSSAHLNIDHKPKRQGHATLTIADDHVHLSLINQHPGLADLEVTVAFGGPQTNAASQP
jgi:serine/threonine protein kinase